MNAIQHTIVDTVQLDEVEITKRSDGIIHIYYKGGITVEVPLVKEITTIVDRMLGDEKHGIMVSADEFVQYSNEARAHAAAQDHNPLKPAVAAIAKNTAQQLLANFYLTVNKPKTPFRMFASISKAEEWLHGYIEGS